MDCWPGKGMGDHIRVTVSPWPRPGHGLVAITGVLLTMPGPPLGACAQGPRATSLICCKPLFSAEPKQLVHEVSF